ncbi:hypothetical protein BKE38_18770 [Pseudoroseomonas deserti]|uniref:DUF2125 domain-containing protein n=1 Tax=Teichococcus deserti TaxID=1817963 RepID=A0A1V2GZ89_9PROT|nr:DUF2125 domain-containing protein [Pseudoroseomonas deserti]ONG50249.1 hypothetical protein BKE38_18770 [Pseudoroseomonas deserti]
MYQSQSPRSAARQRRRIERPRRRRGGRLLLGLVLLLAVLGGGHYALWSFLLGRMEQGLDQWTALRRAQGWEIAHAPPRRGGWPFAARLTLADWRIAGPQGLAWQADALDAELRPTALDRLVLRPQGRQALRLGATTLPFTAEDLQATLALSADAPPDRASLDGRGLRLGPADAAVVIDRLSGELATPGPAETGLTLALEGVVLPLQTPLGPRIESATLDAALNGAPPVSGTPAERAARWRDAGGALELRGLTLRWSEIAASAAATFALDANLQPVGAGTLRLANAPRLLDALVQAGMVPQRSAGMARAILPLMQRPDPNGGAPQLEVPVSLENRAISVARLNLGRIPAIEWK